MKAKSRSGFPANGGPGVAIPDFDYSVDTKAGFFGELQAYDVNTGKRVWRDLYSNSMNWGSVLTTGGGLLFAGGTNDRMFRAYDAKSGEELWHFRTNSGIIAPPSTFEVNGVQYVAVRVRIRRRPSVPADLDGRSWSVGTRTCRRAESSGYSPFKSERRRRAESDL